MDLAAYTQHPLVTAALASGKPKPVPVGFYVVGAAHKQQAAGRSDTAAGFWLINLLSSKRHLLCALKRSDECRCGFRFWFLTCPLLSRIRWHFESTARGLRPNAPHDGSPWPRGQAPFDRQLSHAAASLFVKGDWREHSRTLGLSTWPQNHKCCQLYEMSNDELHDRTHYLSQDGTVQRPLRDHGEHRQPARKCEIDLHIATPAGLQLLAGSFRRYRLRKRGRAALRGRCSSRDVTIEGV